MERERGVDHPVTGGRLVPSSDPVGHHRMCLTKVQFFDRDRRSERRTLFGTEVDERKGQDATLSQIKVVDDDHVRGVNGESRRKPPETGQVSFVRLETRL